MALPQRIKIKQYSQSIKYLDSIFINDFLEKKEILYNEEPKLYSNNIIPIKTINQSFIFNNIKFHIYYNILFENWNDYYYKRFGIINYIKFNNLNIKTLEIGFKIDDFDKLNQNINNKKEILSRYNYLINNYISFNNYSLIKFYIKGSKINNNNYIKLYNSILCCYNSHSDNNYITYINKKINIVEILNGIKRHVNNWFFYKIKFPVYCFLKNKNIIK